MAEWLKTLQDSGPWAVALVLGTGLVLLWRAYQATLKDLATANTKRIEDLKEVLKGSLRD